MGATTATRKPSSRKTSAGKPAAAQRPRPVAVPTDDFAPVQINSPVEPVDVERVPIFVIDGQTYYVDKNISPSVSLRFMKQVRVSGAEFALGGLLEEVLGEDAYDALANCPHVTQQQLADVMDLLKRHVMGAVEVPKGRSKSA